MRIPMPGAGRSSRTSEKLRDTLLRYGKVGLVVHICLSSISLGSCYAAVRYQLPVDRWLEAVGASSGVAEKENTGALGAGSAAMVAFVMHKAIMPLRVPLTVALTPLAARAWARVNAR
eukprot:TRINITY_DN82696_c0_g1_i1.p1 TRINITY_DN82696_c0_g1~~TRINITY_DN82696_c0_g1_i1.p1  ORF type:complete len:118 (+),score=25.67 TRINITY_DN82696_c0_g1_i1:44-397(+)